MFSQVALQGVILDSELSQPLLESEVKKLWKTVELCLEFFKLKFYISLYFSFIICRLPIVYQFLRFSNAKDFQWMTKKQIKNTDYIFFATSFLLKTMQLSTRSEVSYLGADMFCHDTAELRNSVPKSSSTWSSLT